MEKPVLRVLDLCCGYQSVRRAVEEMFGATHEVRYVGVDCEQKHRPTVCADVRTWDWRAELPALFGDDELRAVDFVWASPPCTQYSIARTRGPPRDFELADSIVAACVAIIEGLQPRLWFLENPATGYLKTRPVMQGLERRKHTCSYCMYGFEYRKYTNIWTNAGTTLRCCTSATPCDHVAVTGRHPRHAQDGTDPSGRRGYHPPTTYQVPQRLMRQLLGAEPTPN